jgi:hypothetical protein
LNRITHRFQWPFTSTQSGLGLSFWRKFPSCSYSKLGFGYVFSRPSPHSAFFLHLCPSDVIHRILAIHLPSSTHNLCDKIVYMSLGEIRAWRDTSCGHYQLLSNHNTADSIQTSSTAPRIPMFWIPGRVGAVFQGRHSGTIWS